MQEPDEPAPWLIKGFTLNETPDPPAPARVHWQIPPVDWREEIAEREQFEREQAKRKAQEEAARKLAAEIERQEQPEVLPAPKRRRWRP